MVTQYYKTLYYADHPAGNTNAKTITIAFNKDEHNFFQQIQKLSNHEIRELVGIESYKQLHTISQEEDRSINNIIKRQLKKNISLQISFQPNDSTFVKSKDIPFQRWYPYIEGYSPDYVKSLIQKYLPKNTKTIYDPFAGTGTTIFGADDFGINTLYSEINPLLQFLIDTKITILRLPAAERKNIAKLLLDTAANLSSILKKVEIDQCLNNNYKTVFGDSAYFDEQTYNNILKMRTYIDNVKLTDYFLSNVITVAMLSSLIPVSLLKKQGDVRFKTEKEMLHEKIHFNDFISKELEKLAADIGNLDYKINTNPEFILANAKNINLIKDIVIDGVITSPPYLNGTNYFRNTKIELWFLRYIQFKDDLRHLRDQALTSGINDVNRASNISMDDKIAERSVSLNNALKILRKTAYDKRIPIMINNYFSEIYTVFHDMVPYFSRGAKVVIDIGDSIFSGVHIPTDDIIIDILKDEYDLSEKIEVRKRRSKNNMLLRQSLLIFNVKNKKKQNTSSSNYYGKSTWEEFKNKLPHHDLPYSKRNWGHSNHSLCSYQGKLKPSIANHLITAFVPEKGKILDPFSGVGTIPFEAALNGAFSYGIDISKPAYYISMAKVSINKNNLCFKYISAMKNFMENNTCKKKELDEVKKFGFNKSLVEYYEEKTLKEIILARRFLKENNPKNSSEMLVISSLLHILHGNRPYALSRRSHPIVPYAPRGNFEYKNLIDKLTEKVERSLEENLPINFIEGKIFNQDAAAMWPYEINNLDAVITSPPFFDSTRFYLANWIRLWFAGWSHDDFTYQINSFIEEKQKKDFSVYEAIFRQARERIKKDGVFVLHLGKSNKCDMAHELQKISKKWFSTADIFDENVEHCESHGIRDKGTVTSHQYLVLN